MNGAHAGAFWSRPVQTLLAELDSSIAGLSSVEATARLSRHGPNRITDHASRNAAVLLWQRLRDPLVLILIVAAIVALISQDWLNAAIVIAIVMMTAAVSAFQEHRASKAVEQLRKRVSARAVVLRDGVAQEIPAEEVVAGDIVLLSAGSLVPADGVIVEAKDFFVSQSLLTGETFPVEKHAGTIDADASVAERINCVWMGTSARSGTATMLVFATGSRTAFGAIAQTLSLRPPETEFERGLRNFGALLMRVMLVVLIVVFAVNLLLHRSPIETLLFAMALAVGISPELLPAILTVTLARGAQRMASKGVIVRRLNAIENLGAMNVLCTDKTGTLTRGVVQLDAARNALGEDDPAILRLALINASLQTGLSNPLDQAILDSARTLQIAEVRKLDEIPYDFGRKRLSIIAAAPNEPAQMITKGALDNVLAACDRVRAGAEVATLDAAHAAAIQAKFAEWSAQGFRVLGVAAKSVEPKAAFGREDETQLIFCGFLLFFDPPEPQAIRTLRRLRRMGVRVKIITGDNRLVARHVAEAVGINVRKLITGSELDAMKDEALWHLADRTTLFAEVDPNQKERIIRALQKTGRVVGYLGDGINDAPALQVADVGISVDQAVDVAKEAADFVLLRHNLSVVREGIDEGRHTFANTLKYIYITTSANFGNMISMAIASLALPFLPLLAKQILLNNFLSDIPALGIAGDHVDREWERTPHRWDIAAVRRFMVSFGLLSSAFDLLTFAALLFIAHANAEVFRTGWFIESLLTELLIIFVVRTYKPFYRSKPGRFITLSAAAVFAITLALPYVAPGALFALVPLPMPLLGMLVGISLLYAAASEVTKHFFYRRTSLSSQAHRRRHPH